MKEYSSYKSPSKQLAHSIHKSLRCMPMANRTTHPVFPEVPQRPLDLSNVVPMTPTTARHHAPDPIIDWSSQVLPGQFPMNGAMMDDEHKLIARYSAKLSGRAQYPSSLMLKERSAPMDESLDERAMIARLEEENGEMLREMELLEQQQELENTDDQLNGLRERKAQLEEKMHVMQQTRRQLMQQLEALMSQLNTKGIVNGGSMGAIPESLSGIGSRVTNAFRDHSMPRAGSLPAAQLQGDLLHAADDITTNMGTLLKELDQAQEEMVNGGGAESS